MGLSEYQLTGTPSYSSMAVRRQGNQPKVSATPPSAGREGGQWVGDIVLKDKGISRPFPAQQQDFRGSHSIGLT